MKVLITGGSGYLGARLSSFFLGQGHEITIYDRGLPEKFDSKNKKLKIKYGDIMDKDKLSDACRGNEAVIHLAGINQEKCREDSKLAFEINAVGTKNALEAAEQNKIKKFIFASTFHVYGARSGAISEDLNPEPVTEYAKSKLAGENYCRQFEKSINPVIARLSNVYGAPSNGTGWNLVVNDLCRHAIKEKKIVLKSKGRQKRDFIGISDVFQAFSILMNIDRRKVSENVFNLGGNNLMSIYEVAKLIAKVYNKNYGHEIKIEIDKNAPEEKQADFVYDISRISKLGYKPKSNMEEEIIRTFKAAGG